MKPNLQFLKKVAAGRVYPYSSYSQRMGRVDYFKGGELTAKKHAEAGFVKITYAGLMCRGTCVLTSKGRALVESP